MNDCKYHDYSKYPSPSDECLVKPKQIDVNSQYALRISTDETMLNLVREQNDLLRENNRLLEILISIQREK